MFVASFRVFVFASHRSRARLSFLDLSHTPTLPFDRIQESGDNKNITEKGGGPVEFMNTGSDSSFQPTREVADC